MYKSDYYLKNLIYWLQHKYIALYIIQTIILQITLYVLAKSLENHSKNNMKSVFSKTVIKWNISLFDMLWLSCVCLSFKEKIF